MFNAMFLKNETWLTRRMRITYVMNKRKYLKFPQSFKITRRESGTQKSHLGSF